MSIIIDVMLGFLAIFTTGMTAYAVKLIINKYFQE